MKTIIAAIFALTSLLEAQDLDLGSRVKPLPAANRFGVDGYFVWCGAPVKGPDGKYHLFYSRWPTEVGFAPGWAIHSEIAYAVSDKPAGPYQHVNVALPARGLNPATGKKFWDGDVTHNANAFFHNGKYYLYYMGNYGDGKSYPMHRNHQRVGVAIAENPAGPWKRLDQPIIDITDDKKSFDSLCVTNPAACMRPDGGVVLVYKAVQYIEDKEMGGNVRYGVALADKPEGPYLKTPGHIFEAEKPGKHWMVAEDPFIWFSKKYGKRYYAVTRDVEGTFTGSAGGICLFQSDDGLNWKPAAQPKVLESRFALADGTLSNSNIERPALLIENDEPTYLFGATDGYKKGGKISTNVQIPLIEIHATPPPTDMLDASRVRLLDGPFKQRQELHRLGRLGALEVDRLLFPYRSVAELPQTPDVKGGYGGWDDGFIRGHMAGHYLSAASRMFAATGDTSFRDKANALVDGLEACQKKLGTGHLAAFPDEVIASFEGKGGNKTDILVPYYTIHKVMAGLLDAHHYLGNTKALKMAERMADCYANRMAALTPTQIERLLRTDHERNPTTEFGGMADSLTELARASGRYHHLKLARVFIRDGFTRPLTAGTDRLTHLHANTHVAQAMGIANYANLTGDTQAITISENFWKIVTRTRSFAIGGNSFKEWFDKPNVEAGPCVDEDRILPYNTAETCNTHNMLKLTRRLIERETRMENRAALGDYFERALYNHILSSVAPDTGRVTYFHPLHGDFKTYLKGYECCDGSGIENTGRYGEGIYFRDPQSLYVNLFIPSVVDWKEKGLVIKQEQNIPWQNEVTFTIIRAQAPVNTSLHLRLPDWLSSKAVFSMAGENRLIENPSVHSITRTWKTGDQFSIKLPAALRMQRARDVSDMIYLTYGPLVLAARLGKTGMPDDINDKDIARSIARPTVPAIIGAPQDPTKWLHLTDAKTLTFEARDCGPASGLKFQPVHEIHHERFAVYLRMTSSGAHASPNR